MMITVTLFALAIINVLTKKVATISGVTFTIVFFIVFELSDIANRKRKAGHGNEMEKFRLDPSDEVSCEGVSVRPGNVLVAVRNPTVCSTCSVCWIKPIRARWTSWYFRCGR